MSRFLSAEWIDEARKVLGSVDATGTADVTLQYVISGSPDGKVTLHARVTDGVVDEVAVGKVDAPDIVLSCSYDTALDVVRGVQTADAIFMNGALKVEGDHAGWLLELRDLRAGALAALGPITDD